jgi:hypothetical protein
MKTFVIAVAAVLAAGPAFATCKSDAADKKLAGAALKSFMTKCEKDATPRPPARPTPRTRSSPARPRTAT